MAEGALFDLLTWMSPAWPIGAFAHSSGLEWAVEQGFLSDRATTADWLGTLLEHGPIHNDAVLFVHAWRAAREGDADCLREVAELALAAQTGFERRLEATAQGAAFRRIAVDALYDPPRSRGGGSAPALTEGAASLARPGSGVPDGDPPPPSAARTVPLPVNGEDFAALLAAIADGELTYPIAAAALFAAQGIALRQALTAFLHGALANLVSAAQRLVPLGQTDGQRVLRELRPVILAAVDAACELPEDGDPFDAFAGAALMVELGCMAHETQYTRLFRT